MTIQELNNLIKNRLQRLELMNLYTEYFIEYYGGKRNYLAKIDETLDDINYLRKRIKALKTKK